MTDINTQLRQAMGEVCTALNELRHRMSALGSTCADLSTGGGPHVPVPPKEAKLLTDDSKALSALVEDLRLNVAKLVSLGQKGAG